MPSGNPGLPRPNRRGSRALKAEGPRPRMCVLKPTPDQSDPDGAARRPVLDDQEHQVAWLIAAGQGDRAIAQLLRLAPAEVLAIDLRIRHKLGACSRDQVGQLLPA